MKIFNVVMQPLSSSPIIFFFFFFGNMQMILTDRFYVGWNADSLILFFVCLFAFLVSSSQKLLHHMRNSHLRNGINEEEMRFWMRVEIK